MKQEDQGQCFSYSSSHQAINNYQEQILVQQQQQQMMNNTSDAVFGVGGGFNMFPPPDQVSPWSNIPQYHPFNIHHHEPFLVPPHQQQQQPPSPYASFFNRSSALFNISDTLVHQAAGAAPFGLQAEIGKMTAQEIMEAKALAASKSHSEAERRRRERINNHLAKLRSLLPSTTKTDKASLLAEVIQHVKELKRQTSLIEETSPVPTEADELTVDAADENGRFVIKASLCCEDRSELLPELIKTLKALKLRTLKADITTLGGRVKNVLFITAEEEFSSGDDDGHYQYCNISSIQEALRAVMDKCVNGNTTDSASASAGVKRQRTNIISIS